MGFSLVGGVNSMIQTTSSYMQQPEETAHSQENDCHIPVVITCAICNAGFGLSPARQSLLQAPATVLEAAFMSMCHFCFRCRRPACPSCWDTVHGVCGACVQDAHLPFRVDATPLSGVIFPPVREVRTTTTQENSASQLLVCKRPGRFQSGAPEYTDPSVSAPMQYQIQEETDRRGRTTGCIPGNASTWQIQDDDIHGPKKPRTGVYFSRVVERIVTVTLLIVLLAIAVMVALAEVSGRANTEIVRLVHVDIRYEIAYLVSLLWQLHF